MCKKIIIASAAVLFSAAVSLAAFPNQYNGELAPGQTQASCVLKLTSPQPNRMAMPMDIQTICATLSSTMVDDPAASKALALDAETWPKVAKINVNFSGMNSALLTVVITPSEGIVLPPNAAGALRDELAARAQAVMKQAQKSESDFRSHRQDKLEAEQTDLHKQLADVDSRLAANQAVNGDPRFGGRIFVVPRMDRQSLVEQLAGLRARQQVLESETQSSTALPNQSPWADVISLRQQETGELKKQLSAGKATEAQLLDAEAQLAEARAESASSDDRMQFDRIQLKANIAEAEARLAAMDQSNPTTAPANQPAAMESIADLMDDQRRVRTRLNEVENELDQLQHQADDSEQTELIVLGAE